MRQTDPHFKIRLPVYVREGMRIEAERHHRSTSAEIVHVLECHLKQVAPATDEPAIKDVSQATP